MPRAQIPGIRGQSGTVAFAPPMPEPRARAGAREEQPEHCFQSDYADTLDKAAAAATELRRFDPASNAAYDVAGEGYMKRQQAQETLCNRRRAQQLPQPP